MIDKSILGSVVKDQLKEFEGLKDTVPRTILSQLTHYKGSSAFIVKGVRRCGKSTLMKQIVKARFSEKFYYFNFDDERVVNFRADDFQRLMEVMLELFGKKEAVFFDEIQNIVGWELFVNRLLREGYCVFLTGSNATLLSRELGTRLTGRHVDIELYPFSFAEFLRAKKIETAKGYFSTEEKAQLSKKFREYLELGGMPEVVVFSNVPILTYVLADIVQKDIVTRYNIRETRSLRMVVNFLVANSANAITYRSLKNNFEIKSANTVQKYVRYLEEAYVIFTVQRFDEKIKRIDKSPKKVYCVDNGIITKNSPSTREIKSVLLENLVAVQLKRLSKEFFYYKSQNGNEVDFIIPSENTFIQVCYELTEGNKDREIRSLLDASSRSKDAKLLIITSEQENRLDVDGKKVLVTPAWQWLLEVEQQDM